MPGRLALAAQAPAGADGVLFLPTISGATVPRWSDRMRGVFGGLGMNHGPARLARSVLEGCAFALNDVLGRLDALGLGGAEIRVVGGGARSELWLQIKADVTGRAIQPVLACRVSRPARCTPSVMRSTARSTTAPRGR